MNFLKRLWRCLSNIYINPLIWLGLTFCSFLSLVDLLADYIEHARSFLSIFGLICYAVFKGTVLSLLISFINKRWTVRNWLRCVVRWIILLFISGFVILSVVNGFCYFIYGFGLSRKFFMILGQTNPTETKEFIPGLLESLWLLITGKWSIITILSLFVIGLICKFLPRRIFNIAVIFISFIGALYAIRYMVVMQWGKTYHFVYARAVVSAMDVRKAAELQSEYMSHLHPLQAPETLSSDYRASNIIYVIGESASRKHLSLYGWSLKTTPVFDEMKDSLYIFSDALSSSIVTSENIPRLLTFMRDSDKDGEWYEYPSIVEIFKKLGYSTAWISNQERSGNLNNVSSAFSTQANIVNYVGNENSEDHILSKYDEAVIPPLRKFLKDGSERRFAIVHLMGSHTDYNRRYPPERSRFDADMEMSVRKPAGFTRVSMKRAAYYDNSILYTDSVLGVIFNEVAALNEPSIVIYVSDHGENVFDYGNYCGRDKNSVDVPLVIYANRSFRENNPTLCEDMKNAEQRPLSTSNIIQSILSLSGVNYKFYDSSLDVLSDNYKYPKRYVDGECRSAAGVAK